MVVHAPSDLNRLLPELYDELRRLAERAMRGQPRNHTLQPTALVHEAYLKLAGSAAGPPIDRTHLLATAARAMRPILGGHARRPPAGQPGGGPVAGTPSPA